MKFLANKICLQYSEAPSVGEGEPRPARRSSSDCLKVALRDLRTNVVYFVCGFVVSSVFFLSSLLLISYFESSAAVQDQAPVAAAAAAAASGRHKLGIVVPFRDRFNELATFVPHISRFLARQAVDFEILVVNQVDGLRFNRAALINVGFLAALTADCDYIAMHDVDLLPLNDRLDYSYPTGSGPFHVSAPGLHPDYAYSTFIGGILVLTREHFLRTNGMSNNYWGWGKEDDEFYLRLKEANLTVSRPKLSEFKTGRNATFLHNHDASARPRDKKRFLKQKSASLRKDDSGLDTVQYRIRERLPMAFGEFRCTLINVELFCNKLVTHWCDNKYQFL